ncbi:cytochrome P450 [Thozetella sp. PMI_491]|nr:cytochrome P450 [Thozetella sp. PMI_491]
MAEQEYKLKDVTSLALQPGDKQEVEVEGLDAKVLLVNAGGTVQAIGPKCTHYGAPLKNACFSTKTGDIEDSPGLDALPVFKVTQRDGAAYLTGDAETIKAGRRKPTFKCSASAASADKVVVVGGGSGALGAVEGLRAKGFQGPITVISAEGYLPIDRPKLSKALIPDPAKVQLRDEAWFKSGSVDFVFDKVTAVDFADKSVATESGKKFEYTKLVLATGGTARTLPLQGFQVLDNIFTLRDAHDVKKIVEAIGAKGKKIVIVGSSFIGLEAAAATAGDNDVSVIGMEKAPLERVLGEQVGNVVKKMLESKGIKFYLSASVDKAEPSVSDPSKVGSVFLKDGTKLDADLVILGIGVAPATEYLRDNKIVQLEKDGSLKTDESFSVVGLKDVYAVGDIATYPYHGPGGDGKYTRIEHWNVAQNAGRAAASHIVNPSLKPAFFTPVFWSALGAQVRYAGNSQPGWDDVVIQGKPDEGKWAAFYTKGETVVAVASSGFDPVVMQSSELLRLNKMPAKSQLQQGFDVLFLHPLCRVPGPRLAAISNIWHAYHARNGQMFRLGKNLHRTYGPVVRVGPNEVWVNSKEGFRSIYAAGSGYEKSHFYMATSLAKPRLDWSLNLHFPDTLDLLSECDMKRYRSQRRVIGPVYHATSLRKHEAAVDRVLQQVVAQLKRLDGAEVDLKEWMHIIVVECLGAVVLSWSPGYLKVGSDCGSSAHGYQHWKRRSVLGHFPAAVIAESYSKTFGRLFSDLWGVRYSPVPGFRPFFPGVYQKVSRRVNASLRPEPPKDERKDLLSELIQLHKDKPDEFKENYLRRLAVTNFGAGHETMCSALTSILAMIGSHHSVQKQVTEEVRSTDSSSQFDVAIRLRYTQAAIREAQRLHPAIGMSLSRKVPAGGLSLHGRYIPPGATVGCNPVSLHRNPDIFGEHADVFDPSRWLDEERAKTMERCNLFWGGGARTCPGRHLAELIVYKTASMIFNEFDLKVTMPHEDDIRYYFMAMLTGVKVKFLPRQPAASGNGYWSD